MEEARGDGTADVFPPRIQIPFLCFPIPFPELVSVEQVSVTYAWGGDYPLVVICQRSTVHDVKRAMHAEMNVLAWLIFSLVGVDGFAFPSNVQKPHQFLVREPIIEPKVSHEL